MAATNVDMAFFKLACEHVAQGLPLRPLMREHGISRPTFYDWLNHAPNKEELQATYQRAREIGFEELGEEILEIADDASNDYVEKMNKDGSTFVALDAEHVSRSKLRIESRLKLLAKWAPKIWGDKQTIDHNVTAHDDFLLSLVKSADK